MNSSRQFRLSRRAVLQLGGGMLCAGLVPTRTRAAETRTRLTLSGQALMKHPICLDPYPGLDAVVAELRRGDYTFTDLEVAIRTHESGEPTREPGFFHATGPEVLDCLDLMGFDLLALSNNHAWDLGTEGVLATRNAVRNHGFGYAGTGENRAQASAGNILVRGDSAPVALVSMAMGKIAEGGAATDLRPGVNEVRLEAGGRINPDDLQLNLDAIRSAAAGDRLVLVYLHNHEWGEDMGATKSWAREFAYQCLDAGGSLFISHGAPLLHGIELHDGKPIFHSLGSLVFHSETEPGYYPPEVWQSAIVHAEFDGNRFSGFEIVPVSMNEIGDEPDRHLETRGRPRIASAGEGGAILERLQRLSAALGTQLRIEGTRAYLA